MAINGIGDLNREIAHRCSAAGLVLDCGSDGMFSATIAIIGEAPGEREKISKIPLSGRSGKYLWESLRTLDLTRRNTYVTNAVKKNLLARNDQKAPISSAEAGIYGTILEWEMQQLPNLKYIICLGNYALEAITGLSGIMHHRGSVYEKEIVSLSTGRRNTVTVCPMFNPAYVFREPKYESIFKFDIARFKRVLAGTRKEHVIEHHINPSPNEAIRWIEKMQDERLPTALDIETIGGETACIGLANNPHSGMCINFRDRSSNRFSLSDECAVRVRFQKWFDEGRAFDKLVRTKWTVEGKNTTTHGLSKSITESHLTRPRLVMQNGMFDSYWLGYKDRIILPASFFDTMLAHHTLYPTLPHGLGFLTSQYTEHPFYKDDGSEWKEGGDIDTYWRYNVKDCCITLAVALGQLVELQDQGLSDFFFNHVIRLQPHLIKMTLGGILADAPLKGVIATESKLEVEKLKERFFGYVAELTGDATNRPNPNSPKQLGKLFFSELRLVGRGIATDVKNRQRMRAHPRTSETARGMLTALDEYAKENKFLGTYAEMTIDEDGRIRCEYKQTGVASAPGRLSSTSTMWGSGGNLQNQPERAHKMYIADPPRGRHQQGFGFTYKDLAQAEARVVGWKAPIPKWIDQFERARTEASGYDCHRALASDMYKIDYDLVPTVDWNLDGTPTIRYKTKRCRHGLNYTMAGATLSEQIGVTLSEGEDLHRIYHRTNPELTDWWNDTVGEAKSKRMLFNAYGRRWLQLEAYDSEQMGTLVAFYPQSTIGDKVSRCIYLCHDDPDWPTGEARMALNIHDALVALHSLNPAVVQAVNHVMEKHMLEPIIIHGYDGVTRELIIPSDTKQSVPDEFGVHRWSTLEKVKVLH